MATIYENIKNIENISKFLKVDSLKVWILVII